MVLNQFRIYLKAELGKLRHLQDATNFLAAVQPPSLLQDLCLPSDPALLSRQLSSQAAVNKLVAGLAPQILNPLAKCCGDHWRTNPDLYSQLMSSEEWLEQEIDIGSAYLKPAEPELRELFARLDYHLSAIATDAEVLSSAPYCYASPGDPVAYPVCLAKEASGTYRLFDWMHRAIQLVRVAQLKWSPGQHHIRMNMYIAQANHGTFKIVESLGVIDPKECVQGTS